MTTSNPASLSSAWPLFGIRLHIADLTLRPRTEADLAALAAALPADVELNPAATRFAGAPDDVARGTITYQEYWQSMGNWTTAAWRLNFLVLQGESLLGAQELEGNDFATLRTVDTASFLVQAARGKGIGKLMRRAVLALAFGPLGAEAAITSAWHDNAASLGVSRSLGYADNGVTRLQRQEPGKPDVDTLVHLRMTREQWLASGHAEGITIEGVGPCLRYFIG